MAAPTCRFASAVKSAISVSSSAFSRIAPAQWTMVVAGASAASSRATVRVAAASVRSTLSDLSRGAASGQASSARLTSPKPWSRNACAAASPTPELAPVSSTRFMRRPAGKCERIASRKELQRRQRGVAIEELHLLHRDREPIVDDLQMVPGDAGKYLLFVLPALEIHERGPHDGDTRRRAAVLYAGRLEHVLARARLRLRIGARIAQPLDPQLQQQFILEHQRILGEPALLSTHQRYPVARVLGEQFVPFVESLLIDEPRLQVNE